MEGLDGRLKRLLEDGLIALWLPADSEEPAIRAASPLPWKAIWSAVDQERLDPLLSQPPSRLHRIIKNKSDLPPPSTGQDILFVYDISVPSLGAPAELYRKRRQAEELENTVEGWSGLLVYAGSTAPSPEWYDLIEALAPAANIVLEQRLSQNLPSNLNAISWAGEINSFLSQSVEYFKELSRSDVLDLKDAQGIEIDWSLASTLSDSWELLTRRHIVSLGSPTQNEFDAFLSGDDAWSALTAGIAYERGNICQLRSKSQTSQAQRLDPISYIREEVRKFDKVESDPFDTVNQWLLFSERGSGCTTLLRQMALALARDGYPTLITRPHPRRLALDSLQNLVVHLQDTWAAARSGRGSGAGFLPVCLLLDVDAELPARFAKLVRGLFGDLHRKVFIVRALRRSDQEVRDSFGVLQLTAETNETEILSLGRHLRQFCNRHNLQSIPTDAEWRAFYESFGKVQTHHSSELEIQADTPPLFLIGLYPFVKERVRDEHSLERYLYQRWQELRDVGARKLIEILAAAAAYGIAMPFESLARDPELESALYGRVDANDQRLLDFFFRWIRFGWQKRNWALYIRHPALGVLLTHMLHPAEDNAPYTPLLPVLRRLSGSEGDTWLGEQIVDVLGQRFHSKARAFSLEIDTAIQRAAREIFQAFPSDLHDRSRSICHHHARFYIHLLHSCLNAIEHPNTSHLSAEVVWRVAENALNEASGLLERATALPSGPEKTSNILNTLAAGLAQLAQACARWGDKKKALVFYSDAVERANESISYDAANGHALFNVTNTVLHKFEHDLVESPREALELFELVEDRLETLIRLHRSRQWRNSDEGENEIMLVGLMQRQLNVAQKLRVDSTVPAFRVTSGVARAIIDMREIVGTDTLRQAFAAPARAAELRTLRDALRDVEEKSARAVLLLYKLYLNDPVGRLDFQARLDLLTEIERMSPDEYDPYRHDHAALFCQLGIFEPGSKLFQQIHASKEADPDRWFWLNERVLLEQIEGAPAPKRFVVQVTDPRMGWAKFENTTIRVKIQPRQFGDLVTGQYVPAYIRFRLAGLQAVDERFARFDFESMGFGPADASSA